MISEPQKMSGSDGSGLLLCMFMKFDVAVGA